MERVPAGAKFSLNLIINIFDRENEKELVQTTFDALRLLQDDYLGSSGSRGYGQVKITISEMYQRTTAFYKNQAQQELYDLVPVPAELKKD